MPETRARRPANTISALANWPLNRIQFKINFVLKTLMEDDDEFYVVVQALATSVASMQWQTSVITDLLQEKSPGRPPPT